MITNFLLDHCGLVPLAFVLILLACAVIGVLLLRSRRFGTRIALGLAGLSLLSILALTLVPASRDMDVAACTVQFSLPSLTSVELVANVALFVPLVFFAALPARRPLLVGLGGTVLSALVEAVQALVPAIGRACDTNDWLMNTLGAALGLLLAYGARAVAARFAPVTR
ncbi:VanZ family protein [Amycolatopsis jejuensis]|uniref:VanZ family protein n=1 Tax=Amycolatopsis jejuensis TaxID=330084 RepID=UPI000526BF7B|nr:VanZ family protein [Amycolatopsis jejuensis]